MRDKMALSTAVILALMLLALQHFVKHNLLSPANLETAGKFQRMFQISGLVEPMEFVRPAVLPIAKTPARKNRITGCPKSQETTCPLMRSRNQNRQITKVFS
jgi:hypothetical protein